MDQQSGLDLWMVKHVRHGTSVSPLYQDVKNRDVEPYGVEHQNNGKPLRRPQFCRNLLWLVRLVGRFKAMEGG